MPLATIARVARNLWAALSLLGAFLAIVIAVASPVSAADEPSIAVIVHPSAASTRMSPALLKQIFTRQLLFWPSGAPVVPINFPPGDPLRVTFDSVVLGMTPERTSQYWIDQLVRARAQPPRKLASPGLALRVVAQLKGSIAYVPAGIVTGNVHIAAYVKNGKVVMP